MSKKLRTEHGLGILEMENRLNELRLLADATETLKIDIVGDSVSVCYRGFSAEFWADQYCWPFLKTVHWRLLNTCEFLESVMEKLIAAGKAGIIDLTAEEKAEFDRRGAELEEEENADNEWLDIRCFLREETMKLFCGSDEEKLESILTFGEVLEKHWQEATDFIYSFDDLDNGPKEEVKHSAPETAAV